MYPIHIVAIVSVEILEKSKVDCYKFYVYMSQYKERVTPLCLLTFLKLSN